MKFSINKGGKGKKSHAIGIDLGTTNSCVAVWKNGRVEIITDETGNQTTPTCVSFTNNKQLTGHAAKNQLGLNAANTIYGAKMLIGRGFDEILLGSRKVWPFRVVPGRGKTTDDDWKAMIQVTHKGKSKVVAPEEIAAIVLMKLKQNAESYLGSKVTDAVVTVPAHFNHSQREATKEAGSIAGLNVTRIVHEPVAAAVTYVFNHKKHTPLEDPENILVFDFGGATLDVSLVTIDKDLYDVKASVSDDCLGGDCFDDALVAHFVGEFERKYGKDLSVDPKALARLRTACERVKCVLSLELETTIEIDCLYDSIDFTSQVTRALVEKLNEDLFRRCLKCVDNCLMKASMCTKNVHTVVLVGGSSRIPKVEQMLRDFFKKSYIYIGLNPEVAVAYGATIISDMITADGNKKEGVECEITDFTCLPLGVEVHGGNMSVVAPKHTQLPAKKTGGYTTVYDNQTAVKFQVYEGESCVTKLNTFLHDFEVSGFPIAPKGKPKFDVYFEINKAGILTVSAVHRDTSDKREIVVTDYSLTSLRINLTRVIDDAMNNRFNYKSPQKELINHNQNLKEFSGAILRSVHKKLRHIAYVTCFDAPFDVEA